MSAPKTGPTDAAGPAAPTPRRAAGRVVPSAAPAGVLIRSTIYDRILQAVLEHRLPPGTRLIEDRLAELFDTSRAQVRDVLARFADEGVVTIVPNRGGFIASPTPEETRQVFEARRLIEPALVRRLIAQRDPQVLDKLRAIVVEEEHARSLQDRPRMVRLAGEFHIRMAEYAGNRMLERSMRPLATLTCLAIFLYDAPNATACREDEHERLLKAIERRRSDRAVALMIEHLDHIEHSLDLRATVDEPVDLATALSLR